MALAPLGVSLPVELMVEILLKLPVRSLLRFKCVCKSWLFLISDPQFAKSHFDLAAAPTHRYLVKFQDDSKANSIDIDAPLHTDSADVVFKLPYVKPRKSRSLYVMGSCRGFLLLTSSPATISDFTYFIVWNPSTGRKKRFKKELKKRFVCGIAYDPSTDDYLVVVVTFSKRQGLEVHCFSLSTNSWSCCPAGTTAVTVPNIRIWRGFRLEGSFLNGTLHWLLHSEDNRGKIIAVDVMEGKLSEIPLPHDPLPLYDSANLRRELYRLTVMGGCLCIYLPSHWCAPAEAWTMKEYKVQSSWTKSLLVPTAPFSHFFPMCFTKNGQIFGIGSCGILMKLNDKGELLEGREAEQYKGTISVHHLGMVYRESLLSLY